jgi:hypothetical protein
MNNETNPQCHVELFGRVIRVYQRKSGDKDVTFVVHTITLNKDFTCICPFFCPIQEGDAIYAVCTFEDINKHILRIIRPPFVQIGMDRDSVMRSFIKVLRGTGFGNIKANHLFDMFSKQAGGDDKVIPYITELSALYLESKDDELFIPYSSILSKDQMKKLIFWWFKQRSLRRLYLFGLTNKDIESCHMSHDEIYQRLITNPYTLYTLSIKQCDEILLRQNRVASEEDHRCAEIVRQMYKHMVCKSWTGTPSKRIMELFPDFPKYVDHLRSNYGVVTELFTIYLPHAYKIETSVAKRLTDIIQLNASRLKKIKQDCSFKCKSLTDEQKMAVQGALNSNISVITGGAGTGKSTIIGEIIHNLELQEIKYAVVSFTGKAVSRIREIIDKRCPATMHRLIAKATSTEKFQHLIIDEASMVTTELMYQFFQAFPHDYQITFVGDSNQLPPISWGSLFSQLIKFSRMIYDDIPDDDLEDYVPPIPVYYLTQNHRVSNVTNGILINANRIIHPPEDEPFDLVQTENFQVINSNIEYVYDIIRLMYNNNFPSSQITIITPYNKDLESLNQTFQQIYNDGNRYVTDSRGKLWMVRDRVMMINNNYDINVMNGEEGIIVDVDDGQQHNTPLKDKPVKTITVMFRDGARHKFKLEKEKTDDETLPFKRDSDDRYSEELTVEDLVHSYAMTCHRSQGSEWDYIIVYIPPTPKNITKHDTVIELNNNYFLNRNLVYTAITRAKRACWIVGDIDEFKTAATTALPGRCENLALRMKMSCQSINSSENPSQETIQLDSAEPKEISITEVQHLPLNN